MMKVSNKGFSELLPAALAIIRGPARQLDHLSLVRVDHHERYLNPDPHDWLAGPDWSSSYRTFCRCLTERVAAEDGISHEDAAEVVQDAFRPYLSKAMAGSGEKQSRWPFPNFRSGLNMIARHVPGLVSAWNVMRSTVPGKNDFLLPSLLRRSSRYHGDFMPVYHSIISTVAEPEHAM